MSEDTLTFDPPEVAIRRVVTQRKPNTVDAHVGFRMRERRTQLGFSQERLGELLGVTFQQVQKYERGVNRMGASRLYHVSRVLGVPVQYFFQSMPDETVATVSGFAEENGDEALSHGSLLDLLSTREGVALNQAFAQIPDPQVRKRIGDLVRSIALAMADGKSIAVEAELAEAHSRRR